MHVKRTKHDERSEATRGALIAAARALFALRGFAAVGTEAIVRAAGVTRGALYHQFADKRELFAAVFEQLEAELAQRMAKAAAGAPDPLAALRIGSDAWLEAATEPDVGRIVLLGAVDEAALYVATAEDRPVARAEVGAVLDALLTALAA